MHPPCVAGQQRIHGHCLGLASCGGPLAAEGRWRSYWLRRKQAISTRSAGCSRRAGQRTPCRTPCLPRGNYWRRSRHTVRAAIPAPARSHARRARTRTHTSLHRIVRRQLIPAWGFSRVQVLTASCVWLAAVGLDDAGLKAHHEMVAEEMKARMAEGTWGTRDPPTHSALCGAVRGGHFEVVMALLSAGANPSLGYGELDRAPLHDAMDAAVQGTVSWADAKGLMFALSMAGADVERPPRSDHADARSPMEYAAVTTATLGPGGVEWAPRLVEAMQALQSRQTRTQRVSAHVAARSPQPAATRSEPAAQVAEASAVRPLLQPDCMRALYCRSHSCQTAASVCMADLASETALQEFTAGRFESMQRRLSRSPERSIRTGAGPVLEGNVLSSTVWQVGPTKNWGRGSPQPLESSPVLCKALMSNTGGL